MTIALGILATDGVVIAADTQETIGRANRGLRRVSRQELCSWLRYGHARHHVERRSGQLLIRRDDRQP